MLIIWIDQLGVYLESRVNILDRPRGPSSTIFSRRMAMVTLINTWAIQPVLFFRRIGRGPSMLSYRSKSWIRKNTGKNSREKNVFRSIWPAPTFEQFFIFGISSCIWSPQIGQTLSGHEGWNQRKNAKGQLVESMPITSISPVYPIDLSYPPEMVGFIPLLVLYPYWIPIWIGLEDAGSQHGNDM